MLMTQNLSGILSEALIGRRSSSIVHLTDKRQKTTKVKCKRDESLTKTVHICGEWSSLEEAFEFYWSSFADEHNTFPKSTRRNVKLNKFALRTPWLPDLLCKNWFTSSVWNFCGWVADVPPRETSPNGDKRLKFAGLRKIQRKVKNVIAALRCHGYWLQY